MAMFSNTENTITVYCAIGTHTQRFSGQQLRVNVRAYRTYLVYAHTGKVACIIGSLRLFVNSKLSWKCSKQWTRQRNGAVELVNHCDGNEKKVHTRVLVVFILYTRTRWDGVEEVSCIMVSDCLILQ